MKRENIYVMGYLIRTDLYRYTEWLRWNGTLLKADWSRVVGTELYDHSGDDDTSFDNFENTNLADKPDYQTIRSQLHQQLKNMFQWYVTVDWLVNHSSIKNTSKFTQHQTPIGSIS